MEVEVPKRGAAVNGTARPILRRAREVHGQGHGYAVTGSIPPDKSDLTRFDEASEDCTNGHNFLCLAWERSNVLGTANMDFEINQKATARLSSSFTGPQRSCDRRVTVL